MSSNVLPMLFSKSFTVSGLTFRPLIHFEFIFVYGVRKCSNFILLHVVVQFSLRHLLKRLSLPQSTFLNMQLSSFPAPFIEEAIFAPLYILASFVKNKVPIGVRVYFLAFCLVPLVCILMPVPYCPDDCSFVV